MIAMRSAWIYCGKWLRGLQVETEWLANETNRSSEGFSERNNASKLVGFDGMALGPIDDFGLIMWLVWTFRVVSPVSQ